MKRLRRFLNRLAGSIAGREDDARLRDELESHVEMQAAEYARAGLASEEAMRQARIRLGATEAIRSRYRDEQRLPGLDDFVQDLRYTLRQLRRSPLFTLTATISLALGIGANAAVFTVIERVLLRPLPVRNPHELVYITDERSLTQASPRFSYPFYTALADNAALSGIAARARVPMNAASNGQVVRVGVELVSGSYFDVLGAGTRLGRPLSADDNRTPGAHPVAVISEPFWRRVFAGDPSVIGRGLEVNQRTFTIVGVAGAGFTGTDVGSPTDVWIPMMMHRRELLTDARTNWLEMIGRLRAGAPPERTAEELTAHFERRRSELPPQVGTRRILLVRGERGNSPGRGEAGSALATIVALTALALALACINVASLGAVRSAAREKEMAIRLALGAGRSRLIRQLLTEGVVLAALGGAAGLLIAPWTARMMIAAQSPSLTIDPSLDARVLLFALVVSVATGLIVAQAPILASRRAGLAQASQAASARPMTMSRRLSAHDAIVTLQVGMALAMLISAGLFVQSLRSFRSVDPGFRADNLLLAPLDARAAGYDASRVDGLWRAVLARIERVPGVQSVSLAGTVPFGPGRQRQPWHHPATDEKIEIDTNLIAPRYFATLDIPILRGREFGDEDRRTSRPVVIVNDRLARLFWPGEDPIGKTLRLAGAAGEPAEIVGVVKDAKYRSLRGDPEPMFYRPVLQTRSTDTMTLHVRAGGDLGALVSAIRLAIRDVESNVPLFQVTTLDEQLNASFAQTRQAALMTGVFGLLALLLSAVGVYGVAALAVSRRTRDIGIRMALGAGSRDIVRAIGGRGVALVAAGLVLGLLGSAAFTRVTGTLLFGVTAADSTAFAGAAALLAVVSLAAVAIPVRAATRLDALTAIRRD